MRYGYHLHHVLHHVLVTDCLKANQGKKSHKGVEATIIHHFNTYTSITATKAKPFPDGKLADILLSGITSIDNPTARNRHLDVTSTNPMGVTNQEFINRADLGHQPGPGEHDPRKNDYFCLQGRGCWADDPVRHHGLVTRIRLELHREQQRAIRRGLG